jgi:hypothetical protein
MEDRATRNFLYSEAIISDRFPELAEKIQLPPIDRYKFFLLCALILQPVRDYIDQPVKITSGKCNHDLNVAIGRDPFKTDHAWMLDIHRCAVDFQVFTINDISEFDPMNTLLCFYWMAKKLKDVVGQLIYYSDLRHIHVSLPTPEHYREVLVKIDGEYVAYDPSDNEIPPFLHVNFGRL